MQPHEDIFSVWHHDFFVLLDVHSQCFYLRGYHSSTLQWNYDIHEVIRMAYKCMYFLILPVFHYQGFWCVAEKKVKFHGIFRDKFAEKTADFAGIFEASFAEKRLVKNGRFCGSFPSKFGWKAIGFALI